MGKTRGVHETTPELRNRMVGMYEAGLGLREIAAAVNCSQRTVKRWLNRFDKEGTVETRERCGRKRATTVEQDEAIIRLATQTPITAAKAVLPALGLTCSVDTVRERLHKAGIHNWSPSRKYMQRIPLGDADGAAIQQAVWRPTGTQLGKKKTPKDSNKPEKNGGTTKKKNPPKKIRARDLYVDDGAPADSLKSNQVAEQQQQQQQQQGFVFPQQNLPPPPPAPQAEMQPPTQPLPTSQTEFGNALSLAQQPQPMYQHPGLNIVQNWPLDLVQGSHHYPQGQPNPIPHEQPPPQQQLQELHTQQEQQQQQQQHHAQQVVQQHVQVQSRLQSQPHQQSAQSHHHSLEQPRLQPVEHPVQQQQPHLQSDVPSPEANAGSESSNTCSSNENSQSSCEAQQRSKVSSRKNKSETERQKKKKKGGKVKGTLETSVEIRNRMIGMSEAGLSTLSIALAIDRSERTVKRWLERWHKEGNVQTKERKGRRRITTKEQDEAIVAMATQHPLTAAKYVAPALGLKCSVDTIRERLHKAGIHSWKLGKKQGEGNAVHTVHLWQPSGNRPNKPKMPGEKKKKGAGGKKRDQTTNGSQKQRLARKKKSESSITLKTTPPPANMLPEQPALSFHNPGTMTVYTSGPNIMQPVHNIGAPQPTLPQPQAPPPPPVPQQSMQPMGPMMQQRPDCRLAPTIAPPVSGPGNSGVAYPSCMVGNSGHTGHMEQTDPLNYEPYIWSF
ncbi:PREDICTED: mediator of RNA polymerase II transcription subunit 15-like isoform X2 [Dinoponera quadriceps]|uniref:Mediator of RNA polymerase II transcription subunit 15-like isoform X2 n=1 Tax=Dinoponera quadriceps TaxID=609295 RepID=A0A6P3X5V3_DINQU|nr:PREDICTED: mediator of RNA polymerase II transcription subunit 15-like isoform X2 [Dinoponera quadriceps]